MLQQYVTVLLVFWFVAMGILYTILPCSVTQWISMCPPQINYLNSLGTPWDCRCQLLSSSHREQKSSQHLLMPVRKQLLKGGDATFQLLQTAMVNYSLRITIIHNYPVYAWLSWLKCNLKWNGHQNLFWPHWYMPMKSFLQFPSK